MNEGGLSLQQVTALIGFLQSEIDRLCDIVDDNDRPREKKVIAHSIAMAYHNVVKALFDELGVSEYPISDEKDV